jgi:hypothetical protein
MIKKILVAAAIGAAALGAQASTNLVSNGSLDGTTGSYVYNGAPASVTTFYGAVPEAAGTVADWTGSFVSITSTSGPWGNPSGLAGFHAATFGNYIAGVQADGVLSQELTLAGGTYQLTWSDANRGANQNYSVSFMGTTYDTYHTYGGAGWGTESLTFSTLGGTGLLSFTGGTSFGSTDATSFIDNVSLSAVPEPASMLMMLVGVMSLVAWRRRAQI